MAGKFDFKKEDKELYNPKAKPALIDVKKINFIMVEGKGDPNEADGEFAKAIEILYGLSYTISMSDKSGEAPDGYFEYVVAPLEGLWWTDQDQEFSTDRKEKLIWQAMIRQPEFVTPEVLEWAKIKLGSKKPELDLGKASLFEYHEGECVQMMHIGPYDNEAQTVKLIDQYALANGYENAIGEMSADGKVLRHHEIYLNDFRKTDPEKLKTVIRHPVRKSNKN